MAQHTRSELYKIYKGGFHDKAFEHLVDSALNIKDDGIAINREFGLALSPKGADKKLLSFFEKISDKSEPLWSFRLDTESETDGFTIQEAGKTRLFLQNGGKVGINTERPRYALDVNGMVSALGFVGSYAKGTIFADGKWHAIPAMKGLKGCVAFEIFAHINDEGDRRFALTRATMMLSHSKGGFKYQMDSVQSGSSWLWGKFWNRIKFKWVQEQDPGPDGEVQYSVHVKSRGHYGMKGGQAKKIFYRVKLLWDKKFELDDYPMRGAPQRASGSADRKTEAFANIQGAIGGSSGSGRKSLTIKKK